jgi:hypothetical protein
MPDGYIQLIGDTRQELARVIRERRRARVAAVQDPAYRGADLAPRTSVRMECFDYGDEPLPGWSWPPPRWTGWERVG